MVREFEIKDFFKSIAVVLITIGLIGGYFIILNENLRLLIQIDEVQGDYNEISTDWDNLNNAYDELKQIDQEKDLYIEWLQDQIRLRDRFEEVSK